MESNYSQCIWTSRYPFPNFRLPESNIRFDGRRGNFDFTKNDFNSNIWPNVVTMGSPPVAPWNNLILRPIPFWKDFGLKEYENDITFPFVSDGDTIVKKLPYNAQITPFFKIEADGGEEIIILTDHYRGGGPLNVRSEYVARNGIQEYENLGWMDGWMDGWTKCVLLHSKRCENIRSKIPRNWI